MLQNRAHWRRQPQADGRKPDKAGAMAARANTTPLLAHDSTGLCEHSGHRPAEFPAEPEPKSTSDAPVRTCACDLPLPAAIREPY